MTDSDTLRLLQDAASSFAKFDASRVRSWRNKAPGFDRAVWREMADQGWLGILVAEDAGGLALGLDAAATVARTLGRAVAPEPFVAGGVAVPLLLSRCDDGVARRAALPAVTAGETVAAVAWQNSSGSLDVEDVAANVVVDATGTKLSGEARFVPIPHADAFVVAAHSREGLQLVWLPSGAEGTAIQVEDQADGGASGWLTFADVRIASDQVLASGDNAHAILSETADAATLANCAECLGMMDRALELTLDYLKTREQFGQPIGSFQVLQHRAVDLWMQKEVADHATQAALRKVAAPDITVQARQLAASSAKARVGDVALHMANEAVQLHGAIGFTDEYDLGLYVNRTLARVPYLGNASEHRQRYGTLKHKAGASS
ncbi:MAG: acyl-CoA dehydrogenase family protein [Hyphomicrobiaceae bacterium]